MLTKTVRVTNKKTTNATPHAESILGECNANQFLLISFWRGSLPNSNPEIIFETFANAMQQARKRNVAKIMWTK